jgi:citrate/tricarballylate utilization protein
MLDDLFEEAERQLTICNACRYCEGYCAVFPALERRQVLGDGDITHLANLCHDCRACLYACMYAEPHEFAINPPAVLSAVRRVSYRQYVPGPPLGMRLSGLRGAIAAMIATGLLLALAVVLFGGAEALWPASGASSPYDAIPYAAILVIVLVPCAWSVVVSIVALVRYWRDVHGPLRRLWDLPALGRAVEYAARLRYLRGGGDECYYPDADPTPVRRRLHTAVFYGFLACVLSTVSAAFMQDLLGIDPPYAYLSVPVISGTAGGLAMIVGCTGLIVLKRRSAPAATDDAMAGHDIGFLTALDGLAVTGMLVLLSRYTPAFNLILVVHLATIVVCFAIFPYTKFMHFTYRFLALVKDNIERESGLVESRP